MYKENSCIGKLQSATRNNNVKQNNLEGNVREGFPREIASYLRYDG